MILSNYTIYSVSFTIDRPMKMTKFWGLIKVNENGEKFPEKYQNETFPIFSVYYHAVEIKLPSLSEVPKQ